MVNSIVMSGVKNSVEPGRCDSNLISVFSEHMLQIKFMSTFLWNWSWCLPQNIFDDESELVQLMAWCHQATSHYLSQWWSRSVSACGVTRPQWVKLSFKSFLELEHISHKSTNISLFENGIVPFIILLVLWCMKKQLNLFITSLFFHFFSQNTLSRHHIVCPWGWDVWCCFLIQILIHMLPFSSQVFYALQWDILIKQFIITWT